MKEAGCYLQENIESQLAAVEELLHDEEAVGRAAARLEGTNRIFVVGTGTSYHGALAGQFLLRSAGVDAWAVPAFEFSQYPPALYHGDGLVLLTHRGTKQYSIASLDLFSAAREHWVAVTGTGSRLQGDGVIYTVPQESSPVITVSHVGAMVRLAQLAASLAPAPPAWIEALAGLPDAVRQAVEAAPACSEVAEAIDLTRALVLVGGGPAWATSLEGALKVREAAYLTTIGYEVEEFLHGPTVSLDQRDTVVLIAEPGPSLRRAQDVGAVVREIGARLVTVGSAAEDLPGAAHAIITPHLPEVLAPLVNVIPLQWLAYHLARRAGADADSFRSGEDPYARAREAVQL